MKKSLKCVICKCLEQKKSPAEKPRIFKTFLERDYTPFLKRLLHQRTMGEQMHTEE